MTFRAPQTRRGFLSLLAIGGVSAGLPAFVTIAEAAPSSKLLNPKWQASGTGTDPDSGPWAKFLADWLRPNPGGVTLLDYKGALAAGAGAALSDWITAMQQIDPTSLSHDTAMAYWINLYNAATVQLVLDDYPVKSILRIKGGLFNTGPWDEKILVVNGDALSLNDVEHGILRPIWQDPRMHYAVNCASIGCPNLAAKPWAAGTLDADLATAATTFINHPRGARVEAGQLYVSKIFSWFEEDFGGSSAGIIDHLKKYADDPLRSQLENISHISGSDYDWDLNEA